MGVIGRELRVPYRSLCNLLFIMITMQVEPTASTLPANPRYRFDLNQLLPNPLLPNPLLPNPLIPTQLLPKEPKEMIAPDD
ncbi:hypothetical protein PGT21_005744 [Puccinia graminis f. sp. tritici]|uniref:Uncharacterized protein n=1 Tax=Puccinia graminis f. sp. tritici TaxID=56615 RepID=A0A5B0N9L6_PUCGR|nr:hypothetical protein PGT21_005744 [Puccinia graminis f. sp. tritici]KAA1129943.1 hypothetical protein PGTUg99_008896 [Puccinia graminis f. sp. tritici]